MVNILDTMDRGTRRVRTVIADNYALVLGCLLLVGVLGGYLTYATHVERGAVTETRERVSWQSSGEFTHRATVVNGTSAFAEGRVLRNRTTYFRSVTPRLNGSFTYGYGARGGGDLAVDTTLSLVFRSVESADEGAETVYWRVDRTVAESSTQSLRPGERTTVPFSVNVSAADAERQRIDEELGGTPGELQTVLVARTELSGTRDGQEVDTVRTYRLPIESDGSVYRVDDPGPVTDSDNRSEQVRVPATYGSLRTAAGPLLALLSLGGMSGLVYASRTGWLFISAREREWLAYRKTRESFDDWITTGRVPAHDSPSTVVEVDSLEGLVDVAIDTDNRVIEDQTRNACLVLAGDRWYRYDTPVEPAERPPPETVDSPDDAPPAVEGDTEE
ncbi:DUF5305 domain-containing protein [Haloarcula sediminis]|uniref:DUF5305 domain-containing protein n=1 Tax=Haloarcula sediminis TaxID=3111777 RepID=UPI002D798D31|nr:DUF5305 domain-containing protein [Haloarcula sp. CK38]